MIIIIILNYKPNAGQRPFLIFSLLQVTLQVALSVGPKVQYLKDVVARARDNLASYKSGDDIGEPVFNSKGVAVDIRNLNSQTFFLLPDRLKIAIASCHKLLIKSPNASLEDFFAAMMANPFVEPNPHSFIHRQDKFLPGITHWWNIFGHSKTKHMKEVEDWFMKFIDDPEFLAATHLLGDSSVSMTEATMLLYKALRNGCGGKGGKLIERDVIDLVVLEYPSAENDTFNLHHVNLFAWVDCSTWKKKGGITAEYVKNQFKPRDEMFSKMTPESRARALSFIEDIFYKIAPKVETMTMTSAPTTLSATEFATTPQNTPTPITTTPSTTDSWMNSPTDFTATDSVFITTSTVMETSGADVVGDVDE